MPVYALARHKQENSGALAVSTTTALLQEDPADVSTFDALVATHAHQPERALLYEILLDAVKFLINAGPRARRSPAFQETLTWFEAEATDHLCTLESICIALHMDVDYLRRGVYARMLYRQQHPTYRFDCRRGVARIALMKIEIV